MDDAGTPSNPAMGVSGTAIMLNALTFSKNTPSIDITVIIPRIIPWDFIPSNIAVVIRCPI